MSVLWRRFHEYKCLMIDVLFADNSRKARCSYFVVGMVPVFGGECVASWQVVLVGARRSGYRVGSSNPTTKGEVLSFGWILVLRRIG
jgi:hypothetical protein